MGLPVRAADCAFSFPTVPCTRLPSFSLKEENVTDSQRPGRVSLSEWFEGFIKEHPHLIPRSLREGKSQGVRYVDEPMSREERLDVFGSCETCGERPVSGGETPGCSRAREEGQCLHCYQKKDEAEERIRSCAIYGLCITCKRKAISGGESIYSVRARECRQCLACYRKSKEGMRGKYKRRRS